MSIVVEVQVQPPDLFRAVSGETVGGQKVRDLIFRKRKDNLESQWSAFTADDLEAEVSGFIPARFLQLLFLSDQIRKEPLLPAYHQYEFYTRQRF